MALCGLIGGPLCGAEHEIPDDVTRFVVPSVRIPLQWRIRPDGSRCEVFDEIVYRRDDARRFVFSGKEAKAS